MNYKRNYSLCFLFFILLFSVHTSNFASTSIGVVIKGWIRDIETLETAKFINKIESSSDDSVLIEAQYLKKSINDYEILYGQLLEAFVYYNQGKLKESELMLNALLSKLIEKKNNSSVSIFFYNRIKYKIVNKLFYILKREGSIKEALHIIQTYGVDLPKEKFYLHYALVKSELKEFDEAIKYYQLRLKSAKGLKSTSQYTMATIYNSIGETYRDWAVQERNNHDYLDSAHLYFRNAYELLKNDEVHKQATIALYTLRSGRILFLKDSFSIAEKIFKQCDSYSYFNKNVYAKSSLLLSLAECYTALGMSDSAIKYLNEFSGINKNVVSSKEYVIAANYLYAKNYEILNQKSKAYIYAKKNLDDIEAFASDKQKASSLINQMELSAIKKSAHLLIQQQKNRIYLLAFVSILVVGVLLLLIRFLIKKKQAKSRINNYEIKNNEEVLVKMEATLEDKWIEKIANGLQKLEEEKCYLSFEYKQDFVAKRLNTNKGYISIYFNNYLKKTFTNYVNELRMKYVVDRLQKDNTFRNYSLHAISEEIGYKSINTFTKAFKEFTNKTPSVYIEELQQSIIE